MLTKITFNDEARLKMKSGVDQLANAVKATLGAKGRNVAIRSDRTGKVHLTKDGVTVARAINLVDKVEDMGAQMIKEAAMKTGDLAGDGTTTSTVLAQAMIEIGMRELANGRNPVGIKKGMDKAVQMVTDHLKNNSEKITPDRMLSVATIAANNDAEIGKLVADVLQSVGDDGIVTLQDSNTADTFVEKVEGMQIEKGYISHYFVNNKEKMTVEYNDCLILMYDRKISSLLDIEPALNTALANKKPLLIIAEDVDGEALSIMTINKLRGDMPFVAIRLPGFGNMHQGMLEDIATVTGGKVVSPINGDTITEIKTEYWGRAKKIVITELTTTIFGGAGKKADIDAQIESVKSLMSNQKDQFEYEKLRHWRLAKLTNGVAILHVGANTDVEMKEKKDRIDDALRATRCAIEEGIVPGGGVAYVRSIYDMPVSFDDIDEDSGMNIITQSIQAPLRQILLNAGISDDNIFGLVSNGKGDYGYNVKTNAFEQFLTTGVIDPTKVSRVALENAASVASMFLTTECAIEDVVPEK